MGPGKERNPVPVRPASDEAESDAPTYDSCFDDLNLLLAASINEPDPNLESAAPGETLSASSRIDESAEASVSDRGKAPRTSEIFRALAASARDAPSGTPSHDERSQSVKSAGSPDEVRGIELTPDRPPASGRGIEGQPDVRGATDTDDSSDAIAVSLDASPSLELFERTDFGSDLGDLAWMVTATSRPAADRLQIERG